MAIKPKKALAPIPAASAAAAASYTYTPSAPSNDGINSIIVSKKIEEVKVAVNSSMMTTSFKKMAFR